MAEGLPERCALKVLSHWLLWWADIPFVKKMLFAWRPVACRAISNIEARRRLLLIGMLLVSSHSWRTESSMPDFSRIHLKRSYGANILSTLRRFPVERRLEVTL